MIFMGDKQVTHFVMGYIFLSWSAVVGLGARGGGDASNIDLSRE